MASREQALMNARPNQLGDVQVFAEYENRHAFRALRHFPDIKLSVSEITTMQKEKMGRNWNDRNNPNAKSFKPIERTVVKTTTHLLDDLSKSSVQEINALQQYRHELMKQRLIEKKKSSAASVGSLSKKSTELVDPLVSARTKLATYSTSYNSQSFTNVLQGFKGEPMTKDQFSKQLRRSLNLNLSQVEMDALFASMDVDGSGAIDPVEFVRYFFETGNANRRAYLLRDISIKKKMKEDEEEARRQEERERAEWEEKQVGMFSPSQEATAMEKLRQRAIHWDQTNDIDAICATSLEGHFKPPDFKRQLEAAMGVKFTPGETGALIKRFSTLPGEFCMDGKQFLTKFISLKNEAQKDDAKKLAKFAERRAAMNKMGQQEVQSRLLGRGGR